MACALPKHKTAASTISIIGTGFVCREAWRYQAACQVDADHRDAIHAPRATQPANVSTATEKITAIQQPNNSIQTVFTHRKLLKSQLPSGFPLGAQTGCVAKVLERGGDKGMLLADGDEVMCNKIRHHFICQNYG